jgi:hypothetical protein
MSEKTPKAEYSDEEAERRAREAIKRSFAMPHKPHKALVGTTPRAKMLARQKAVKGHPKSRGALAHAPCDEAALVRRYVNLLLSPPLIAWAVRSVSSISRRSQRNETSSQ